MILIVGLGNPGKKYERTRHNVGFRAVDKIAANFQFSIFNFQSIFNAQISKGEINGKKIILAKPQTFMNNSGKAVKFLIGHWSLVIGHLFIVHDDIDLPLGKIRIVKNRGAAGHKGVESIIRELATKNFVRFRIGIKPLKHRAFKTLGARLTGQAKQNYITLYSSIDKFVLEKFNRNEEKIVKKIIEKTVKAVETTIKEGIEKAMNEYNK